MRISKKLGILGISAFLLAGLGLSLNQGIAETKAVDPSTVTLTMADMGYENSKTVASVNTGVSGLTISITGGTYYTSGTSVRIYQSSSGAATVGYSLGTINSITWTFTVTSTGTWLYGTDVVTSATAVTVGATSASFAVGNSGTAVNGQVRVSVISINYTPSADPAVSLDKSSISTYNGAEDSTIAVADVANMTSPYTYVWTVTSGTSASISGGSDTDTVSIAISGSISGDTVIRCTVTDSAAVPLAAYAECTVSVDEVLTVDQLLDSWVDGIEVFVKGYVVGDNISSSNKQYRFASETQTSYVNETGKDYTAIDLYCYTSSYDSKVVKGNYLLIKGVTSTFSGTREIGNGYTVISETKTAATLSNYVLGSETADQCTVKYAVAKAHYDALSTEEKTAFTTSATYADAYARYLAWGTAVDAASGNNNTGSISTSTAIIISVAVAVLGLTSAGVILILKKKKETF